MRYTRCTPHSRCIRCSRYTRYIRCIRCIRCISGVGGCNCPISDLHMPSICHDQLAPLVALCRRSLLYFCYVLKVPVGGSSWFCAAARAARPTGAHAAHSPYVSWKVSHDLSGQRAEKLQDPPTPCARPPAPRRSSAASAASSPPSRRSLLPCAAGQPTGR